jgi:hypothetical protein
MTAGSLETRSLIDEFLPTLIHRGNCDLATGLQHRLISIRAASNLAAR